MTASNVKKKKSAGNRKGTKRIQFSLSFAGLFSYCFLGCLAMIWVFILGVIVGRGYHPERLLPEIARLIPGYTAEKTEVRDKEQKRQVLKPKDLNFFDDLKKKVRVQLGDQAGSDQTPDEEHQDAPSASAREKMPRYHSIYQVAAFKTRTQAARVVSKLQKNKLQAAVHPFRKPDQDWYRVYVSFTGRAQEIQQLESKLKRLGLEHFFLRSKTLE